tara:strand:+ start:1396 stop:3078 length:1683 start_codon:yes stop_codon:yes gene_type:complete
MILKKIIFTLLILIFYQSPLYSKSNSFEDYNTRNLSKYFSGIVAYENKDISKSLEFFNSSKNLINKHNPYLKRYIYSLILENKISQAISIIKRNKNEDNTNFFEAKLLLILDSLKKKDFNQSYLYIIDRSNVNPEDKFNLAILENLEQYTYVFKKKEIPNNKKNYGKLSTISETFQRCYLGDKKTDSFFSNLFNDLEVDYTRYIFFYLSYLIENNKTNKAKEIVDEIDYINSTLLLSQGKNWIENGNEKKLIDVFSCKDSSDLISEFLFLISNLYSSQDDFEKSNFYLNLSNFLNPKFVFNLSLIAENQYLNKEYKKLRKTLKNFKKEDFFYYWYRVKKEANILSNIKSEKESIEYIETEFKKIKKVNNKILYDIANIYKNSEMYDRSIKYYTKLINSIDQDPDLKSDLFYRRGGAYERLGNYKMADKDLLSSLKIDEDDAYVLNYLAYSWLERNQNIDEAIEMLEIAYASKSNDPYIIDSIGWAYYLVNDFDKAESFLKRAVELMPDDPIVNDHYGDILWKLNRKIQARYFWSNVLKMKDADKKIIENINIKMTEGLKS